MLFDNLLEVVFTPYWNAIGVKLTGKFWRINSTLNIWDLCGSKCYYLIFGVVSKEGVEVMEVSSGCSENDYPLLFLFGHFYHLKCLNFAVNV